MNTVDLTKLDEAIDELYDHYELIEQRIDIFQEQLGRIKQLLKELEKVQASRDSLATKQEPEKKREPYTLAIQAT